MDVISQTSVLVTGSSQTFHWVGYGLKLHIPQGTLPPASKPFKVHIKAALSGQFEFPQYSTLVSALYSIYSPVKFSQPVTLEVQHCAKSSDLSHLSFVVAKCTQKELPYRFTPTSKKEVFSSHTSHGSIVLDSFSILGIINKLAGADAQQYCASLYYFGSRTDKQVDFVVTQNLETCITVSVTD